MWVNPSSVSIDFNQRRSKQDTIGGFVISEFKGGRNNFRTPTIQLSCQTGNIMPFAGAGDKIEQGDIQVQPGLRNLYDFLELIGTSVQLEDGAPNYITFLLRTYTMPNVLVRGFFDPDSAYQIEDDAENINGKKYTISFLVVATEPKITDATSMISLFKSAHSFAKGKKY